jgi:hypothetical protein
MPFRDFTAEEFRGRTLTIGAGGGFFREAVSLSARWLMRAFMLARAPTSIRKRSGSIADTPGPFRPVPTTRGSGLRFAIRNQQPSTSVRVTEESQIAADPNSQFSYQTNQVMILP